MSEDNSPLKPLSLKAILMHTWYLNGHLAGYIRQLKGFESFPSPVTFPTSNLAQCPV